MRIARLIGMALAGSCCLGSEASGQVISEDSKLLAEDGTANDEFGRAIDIDNGVVAVGAYRDDDNGSDSGSAYLFDAATGIQIAKLVPSDGAAGDLFGYSIAIDSGLVAVGAYFNGDNGGNSGSAYVFDAVTGVQIAKLLPADGAPSDWFGYSIAISNGVVAVGTYFDDDNGFNSGSAYVFDAATGIQIAKLLPADGEVQDLFGCSIAIDNGVVAVGARHDDDNGSNSGSAYLFDAATGVQITKLLPADGAGGDLFGLSIAIESGIVAVGAWANDDIGSNSGSAYLFNAATGSQIAKFLPSDGAADDRFGYSIAIDNGIVAIGAFADDDKGSDSGSVYLFDAATRALITKLLPSDGTAGDEFGYSVAIDNGVVASGAIGDDDNGSGSGSATVFTVCPEKCHTACPADCLADLNEDCILDHGDIVAFIDFIFAANPRADINGDGINDNGDIVAFIEAFLAGC